MKKSRFLTKLADCFYCTNIYFKKNLFKTNKNIAVLIGTPTHYNIGDHLIAYNEKKVLKEMFGYSKVVEIPTRFLEHNKEKFCKNISINTPVFITGGGWMGNIWPEDQNRIEVFIELFKEHKIIIFPQTIYYNYSNEKIIDDLEKTNKIYSSAKQLIISCRDDLSYHNAIKYFKGKNITVVRGPDMGLFIRNKKIANKTNSLAYCIRKDREQVLPDNTEEILKKIAKDHNYHAKSVSTMNATPIPVWYRNIIVKKTIHTFEKPDIVITDRLHGMIFSIICDTKCIAFDNKTHKVKGVYDLWLKRNPKVKVLDHNCDEKNFEKELLKMIEFDSTDDSWNSFLDEEFKKYVKTVKCLLDRGEEML